MLPILVSSLFLPAVLLILLILLPAIPLNKQLYSFSYVCLTAGAAALVFSAFYVLVCEPFISSCFCHNWADRPLKLLSYICIQSLWVWSILISFWVMVILAKCFLYYLHYETSYWLFNIFLSLCQVDILGLRWIFLPLEWIGMNAMLVYVMAAEGIFAGFINGWYYENPHNTLVSLQVLHYYNHTLLR